jgi:hypothetical protein
LPLILHSFKSPLFWPFSTPHTCSLPSFSLISSQIHAIHMSQEATAWTIYFWSSCNCSFYPLLTSLSCSSRSGNFTFFYMPYSIVCFLWFIFNICNHKLFYRNNQ